MEECTLSIRVPDAIFIEGGSVYMDTGQKWEKYGDFNVR
jgi:hypothetical protein